MGGRARSPRAFAFLLLAILAAGPARADRGIELTALPAITVADGRSTITVTAIVRDSSGRIVPDGTQVVFETTLGNFRESVVLTQNGFASAVLVASDIVGVAKVRAGAIKFNASAILEIPFVDNKSVLSSRKDYIEVVAPLRMAYSLEDKILEASGEGQGVHLRYRDIVIEADDLQLKVTKYEVRARNAKLTMGDKTWELARLYMRLDQRRGIGTEVYQQELYIFETAWFLVLPEMVVRERIRGVEITASGLTPTETPVPRGITDFVDISEALTIIEAKKAVAYPSKEVHFHRAKVTVGGQHMMTVPLFRASTRPRSPLVTDDFFDVSQNNLAIDYPYYVDLKPGQTSLFRLKYGRNYGTGLGGSSGTFLDYEFNWNQGIDMDGGLTLTGLARKDWGLNLRQFWKPSSAATLSAQINFPAHRSMFANVNLAQNFDGFYASINASHGQNIAGERFRNDRYTMLVEKNPIDVGRGLAKLSLGLTASQTRFVSPLSDSRQERFGVRARLLGAPIPMAKGHTMNLSYTVSRFTGSNLTTNMSHQATMALTSTFPSGIFLRTTYDYVADGITDFALGQHRISADAYYGRGAFTFRGFASKSLDIQRL
ncbi:MAG: Ig-like domain-containing protein, partial [Armatimonadetes bacterium]|nr:Ig-like domain-containing protein [Armatimonadota bacterium]